VIVTRVTDYITGFGVSTAKTWSWRRMAPLLRADRGDRRDPLPRVSFDPAIPP